MSIVSPNPDSKKSQLSMLGALRLIWATATNRYRMGLAGPHPRWCVQRSSPPSPGGGTSSSDPHPSEPPDSQGGAQ